MRRREHDFTEVRVASRAPLFQASHHSVLNDPIIIGRKTTKLGGVMHQMRYERIDWVGIEALSPKRAKPVNSEELEEWLSQQACKPGVCRAQKATVTDVTTAALGGRG